MEDRFEREKRLNGRVSKGGGRTNQTAALVLAPREDSGIVDPEREIGALAQRVIVFTPVANPKRLA